MLAQVMPIDNVKVQHRLEHSQQKQDRKSDPGRRGPWDSSIDNGKHSDDRADENRMG